MLRAHVNVERLQRLTFLVSFLSSGSELPVLLLLREGEEGKEEDRGEGLTICSLKDLSHRCAHIRGT